MGWAVILLPDEAGDAAARRIWRPIYDAGFHTMLVDGNNRPHVSLMLLETQDGTLDDAVQKFAENTRPVTVTFASIGNFGEDVIYLSPEPAAALHAMNRGITGALGPLLAMADGHYLPGEWRPHMTVAFKIPEGEFSRAMQIVRNSFVPFTTTFSTVAVVKYYPVKITNTYKLPFYPLSE